MLKLSIVIPTKNRFLNVKKVLSFLVKKKFFFNEIIIIDSSNIFAVGFSNGGYWAAFLAATGVVNAGISHYGVWDFPGNYYGYPAKYFRDSSNPVLALIGKDDKTQRYEHVMAQVQMAEKLSPRVVKKIYNASHAWDCAPCNSEYVYNEITTMDAFKSTIYFMKENSK